MSYQKKSLKYKNLLGGSESKSITILENIKKEGLIKELHRKLDENKNNYKLLNQEILKKKSEYNEFEQKILNQEEVYKVEFKKIVEKKNALKTSNNSIKQQLIDNIKTMIELKKINDSNESNNDSELNVKINMNEIDLIISDIVSHFERLCKSMPNIEKPLIGKETKTINVSNELARYYFMQLSEAETRLKNISNK
jgi:hypothetical protein